MQDSNKEELFIGDFVTAKGSSDVFVITSDQDEFGEVRVKSKDFRLSFHPSNLTKHTYILKLAHKEG
jgi:hypothetical protein